jgi:hypothetical protein
VSMNTMHLPDNCSEMSTINQDSLFNGLDEVDAIALYIIWKKEQRRVLLLESRLFYAGWLAGSSHVDPKEVVSQAAYVLYYHRRDVLVGQEYALNLQTNVNRINPAAPAIIHDPLESKSQEPSEVSSSAAMVGDDDDAMDVIDKTDEKASRSTSPMGLVVAGNNALLFVVEHDYDSHDDSHSDYHHGSLPYDSHDENSTDNSLHLSTMTSW